MRNFALLLIIVFLNSCFKEKTGKTTVFRTIKNSSSYSIDLTIYGDKESFYRLESGDSITFQGYCTTGFGPRECVIGWSVPVSAKIVFNEEKEIDYSNSICESGRNPIGRIEEFDLCGYVERGIPGRREYAYFIDDTDYDIATLIVN